MGHREQVEGADADWPIAGPGSTRQIAGQGCGIAGDVRDCARSAGDHSIDHFFARPGTRRVEDDQVGPARQAAQDPVHRAGVEAGPGHPLRFVDEEGTGGLKPYVLVRGRLEALLARPVMYELVGHGEEVTVGGETMFAVRSRGTVFPLMPAERLRSLSR